MRTLKQLLLLLTPLGAAALVAGGGTFSSFDELAAWSRRPKRRVEHHSDPSLRNAKRALLALMLIGGAAYLGLSGTFANFQAETSNNGDSISSGTLTMNNQVNTNTACLSANAPSADNINSRCDSAFSITNVSPGTFASTNVAKIVVTNTGSIDGSKLYLYASQPNGKLATQITSGNAVTTISLTSSNPTGFEGSVATSDSIVVSYAGHSQTFTASAPATGGATSNGGATSISVTSQTASYTFPVGSTVTDTSGNTTASNTDCYDAQTTTGGTPGSTYGTQLNFNPLTGNPFCGSVLMWVQEVTGGGQTYCWFGKGSTWSSGSSYTEDTNGLCVAPIYDTTTGISGTITSIPLASPLNGNVHAGDTITVTQGTNTQNFTASATTETYGATSISVNSTAVGTAFTSGAVVTDPTAQTSLNSNASTDNVSAFDTAHHLAAGKLELFPVTTNGHTDTTSGAAELTHYNTGTYTRTFYVGLYLPAPGGSNQNALQGLASTFGLTWHMDQ